MDDELKLPCKDCDHQGETCQETCEKYREWREKFRELVSEYAKTSSEDYAKRLWNGHE